MMDMLLKYLDNQRAYLNNNYFDLQTEIPVLSHIPLNLAIKANELSKIAGLGPDAIINLILLLLAIPFGLLLRYINNKMLRHLYTLVFGVLFAYLATGAGGVFHPLIMATITYLTALLLPNLCGSIILIFAMSYLSAIHLYRLHTDYLGYTLDHSGICMVLTTKLCMFAYNYSDGLQLQKGNTLHKIPKINEELKARALHKLPNLIEFYSYCFTFFGVLAGPSFEIRNYLEYMDGSNLKQYNIKKSPSPIMPMIKTFLKLIFCTVILFAGMLYLPINGFIDSDEFVYNWPFWKKYAYMLSAVPAARFKYHFVWTVAELGCIASGFGFSGFNKDGSANWENAKNGHPIACEFATSIPGITNNWNLGINNWLKYYVYFRIRGSSGLANVLTKLTSAFWHGFYPGYYLFFGSVAVVSFANQVVRKRIRILFYKKDDKNKEIRPNIIVHILYSVIAWVALMGPVNYMGVSFLVMAAEPSFKFWKSMYYAGHWGPLLVYLVVTNLIPKPKAEKVLQKKVL